MPELPEVECVRQGILEAFLGHRVRQVWSRDAGLLLDPLSLPLKRLEGKHLKQIERKGKYLRWHFEAVQLLAHLGMSGVWETNGPKRKHTRVVLTFENGHTLSYTDPRQFGYLCVSTAASVLPRWEALGPDAISMAWNTKYFLAESRHSRVPIKVWLLDQHHVAGIGNIYASEALFRAAIHPGRPANSLKESECAGLVRASKAVMRLSIRKRGTTFSDYRLTNGRGGSFQSFLKVFQKQGEPCPRCGAPIRQEVQAGRSTFFCPVCQPSRHTSHSVTPA